MTPTPRLTVKINGVTVGGNTQVKSNPTDHLYMFYFQTTLNGKRNQWVVFPPPIEEALPDYGGQRNRHLALSRTQEFPGNRSRWSSSYIYDATVMDTLISTLVADGHTLGNLALVPVNLEDLKEAYSLNTPNKALRAVDRVLGTVYHSSIK